MKYFQHHVHHIGPPWMSYSSHQFNSAACMCDSPSLLRQGTVRLTTLPHTTTTTISIHRLIHVVHQVICWLWATYNLQREKNEYETWGLIGWTFWDGGRGGGSRGSHKLILLIDWLKVWKKIAGDYCTRTQGRSNRLCPAKVPWNAGQLLVCCDCPGEGSLHSKDQSDHNKTNQSEPRPQS